MILSFLSFLSLALFVKLTNDLMIRQMFEELCQKPTYYRNTYQLPRTINPLTDRNSH
jgi:hypothetical protein